MPNTTTAITFFWPAPSGWLSIADVCLRIELKRAVVADEVVEGLGEDGINWYARRERLLDEQAMLGSATDGIDLGSKVGPESAPGDGHTAQAVEVVVAGHESGLFALSRGLRNIGSANGERFGQLSHALVDLPEIVKQRLDGGNVGVMAIAVDELAHEARSNTGLNGHGFKP